MRRGYTYTYGMHDRSLRIASIVVCLLAVVAGVANYAISRPVTNHEPSERAVVEPAPPPPVELPWGGRMLFPANRFVALYGTPGEPALGVLGEQPLEATIQRARDVAAAHQPFSREKIIPTLEVITTVASSSPTSNGDYSNELPAHTLQPLIDAARKAGVYVVLDIQPGRGDFLTQVQAYEALLAQPGVGLALDPEWRVRGDQVPLGVIGSVGIDEVNRTAAWLAGLTEQKRLPQKMFLIHQFRLDMVTDRERLDMSHFDQLAYVIQMDGHGSPLQKQDTWSAVMAGAQPGVVFGWKNFYDEDDPMLSPQQTMEVSPTPWFISYQ